MKKIIIFIFLVLLLPIKIVNAVEYECEYTFKNEFQEGAKNIKIRFNDNDFSVYCGNDKMGPSSTCEIPLKDGNGSIVFTGYKITLNELFNYYYSSSTKCSSNLRGTLNGIISFTEGSTHIFNLSDYKDLTITESETNSESNLDSDVSEKTDCNGELLGYPDDPGSPAYYLVKVFHVIKYVALVLLVVLSVMDFTGAIASHDADVIKKVTNKLIMRFIICVIIFLLPYLIELFLKYLVERNTSLCGIE